MRLFGSERIARIMERMGLKEGEVIKHPMITRSVERAQKKVEENNYGIRKRLLEYDDVMNQQREVIYARRNHALLGEHLRDDIFDMLRDAIDKIVEIYYPEGDIEGLRNEVRARFITEINIAPEQFQILGEKGVADEIFKTTQEFYRRKEKQIGSELMTMLEKMAMLQVIDEKWRDHLREMDDLKEGIHLRGYGQKDPLVEYKGEAFKMFMELMDMIATDSLNMVFKFYPEHTEQLPTQRARRSTRREDIVLTHDSAIGAGFATNKAPVTSTDGPQRAQQQSSGQKVQQIRSGPKIGRNDPCPCGSGKKYKNCHGS
jgi:preprotein translocase subunit SecA